MLDASFCHTHHEPTKVLKEPEIVEKEGRSFDLHNNPAPWHLRFGLLPSVLK
jgi:hypothetical protein